MQESKRKQIEAKLRELMSDADNVLSEDKKMSANSTQGVRVIRRRKGVPERQIR